MKRTKKTESITFRTTRETRDLLEHFAEERDWTVSQLCERTMSKWAENEKKILMGIEDEPEFDEEIDPNELM